VEVEEGRMRHTYNYNGRGIVTTTVNDNIIQEEIRWVKSLVGSCGEGWVEDQCVDSKLWEDDRLKKN
jgi:hypothetical protein